MISALLAATLVWAAVVVEDGTNCIDPDAVRAALDGVPGADRITTEVSVLPEGDVRAVRLVWEGLTERELEVLPGDCPDLPAMIALATERVLAELPTGLRAGRSRWVASVGGAAGSGIDAWAPRVAVWIDGARRAPVGPWVGAVALLGAQPVAGGSAQTAGLAGRGGVLARAGRVRFDLGALVGALAARGVGLTESRVAALPIGTVRAAGRWEGPVAVGLGIEVPLLRPVYRVDGGGRAAEPALRAILEVGFALGDDRRPRRAQ